jgi:hypothetical protein
MMFTLIATCRLTDVLTRIADLPQTRLPELLPWHWKKLREPIETAQAA